ncbi:MAG TPA: PTS system mannose/fructose/sorbose family transporter subunit IID [Acidobacteriota bacterium]|nr:PTS system mannose/fructose/sorbose family transporter subunit IID [Acidobacteriota bacterium]
MTSELDPAAGVPEPAPRDVAPRDVAPSEPAEPKPLRARDFGAASARLLHLQAILAPERMQGPGFAFALVPILRRLYPEKPRLAEALVRHSSYVATHPVLAGYVLGAAAGLEEWRAAGAAIDPERIDALKRALASPLAAMGDPFFWVTLRPFAGLVGVLGIALFGPADPSLPDARVLLCPFLLLLTYNAVAIPIRWRSLRAGYRGADRPAEILRALRLTDARDVLERGGALLYGALVTLVLAALGTVTGRLDARDAAAFAPLGLGFLAARAWLRRSPSASVEVALAVLALAAAVSLVV